MTTPGPHGVGAARTTGLHVTGLSHRFAGTARPALDDVTLSVPAGEVLAVVGPSGSGKSTLLRLLCGLLPARSGRIELGGVDVTRLPPERRPVAMVFQGFALFPHLTVRGNIEFGLRVRRTGRAERAERVSGAADALGLTPLLERMPGQLSGGERQRVALARALVRDPAVFCLDEPLSSLDPLLRASARGELDPVLRADGRCAVHVTHDQAEAGAIGDRVAVLRDGRLEQVGTWRELYDTPATTFVAGFLGTPPMALLPVDGAGPLRTVGLGPAVTVLGVRAEDVRLGPGDDLPVRRVEDHGHELLVEVALPGGSVVARVPAGTPVGGTTSIRVDPARVRRFGADGRARP